MARLAVFADGYYEGEAGAAYAFGKRRLQEADDLRYWIAVLNELPLGTDEDVRSFLKAHLVKRAMEETERSTFAENLRSLAVEDGPRPPGWVRTVIDGRRTEAQDLLAARVAAGARAHRTRRDA